jgi:glycosyltransferase involved in cell wall biosynthesis
MRILIATGIFPPDIGGPATYAPAIAAKLHEAGWNVSVLAFSDSPQHDSGISYPFRLVRIVRGNRLLNRVRFFFAALREARDADLVYTLDWFAAGLPVALAAKILRKPYVVRVGGDWAWESAYSESSDGQPVPLGDFYERGLYRHGANGVAYRIIRFVLRGASRVIFNSDMQRELYLRFYGLSAARVSTICNPVPRVETTDIARGIPTHEIVYWGRLVVLKNLGSLVRAFAKARLPEDYTLALIGDGPQKRHLAKLIAETGLQNRIRLEPPMPLPELLARVKNCRAAIVPSWTEISPNQVCESLAIGLPALVTKENYLSIADQLPETIDPRSIPDIAAKLEMLADDARYENFSRRWRSIEFRHTWDDVLAEHLAVFSLIV